MQIFRKIGKFIGWILIGLISLVLIFALSLQTKPVKKVIAKKVQVEVNKLLDAELSISSIDGNFFNGIGLNNVFLKQKGDTVGYIPSLKLKYKLLPLLQGSILVNSVEMENPILYVTQFRDSTWNFQKIMKPKEKTDTVPTPFTMKLNIEKVKIDNGTFLINALDSIFPRKVHSLNTDLSFRYSQDELDLKVDELSFVAQNPDLTVQKLSLNLKKDSDYLQIKDLLLQTAKNRITGHVEYDPKRLKSSYADLFADSIHAEEFQFLFPQVKIPAHPTLALKTRFDQAKSTMKLDLKEKNESMTIDVESSNLVDYLNKTTSEPLAYHVNGRFDNVNMKNWIDDPSMQYKFTGNFAGQGSGIDPKTMQVELQGDFRNMILQKRQVDKLNFDLDYLAGSLKGVVDGSGNFGKVRITPVVRNVFDKKMSYTAGIATNRLDLSKLMLDKKMKSNLNLNANVKGEGFDPKTMTATATGNLKNTSMYDYTVDNMNFDLN